MKARLYHFFHLFSMLPEILTDVLSETFTAKPLTIDVVVFEIDLNTFYSSLASLNCIDEAT